MPIKANIARRPHPAVEIPRRCDIGDKPPQGFMPVSVQPTLIRRVVAIKQMEHGRQMGALGKGGGFALFPQPQHGGGLRQAGVVDHILLGFNPANGVFQSGYIDGHGEPLSVAVVIRPPIAPIS